MSSFSYFEFLSLEIYHQVKYPKCSKISTLNILKFSFWCKIFKRCFQTVKYMEIVILLQQTSDCMIFLRKCILLVTTDLLQFENWVSWRKCPPYAGEKYLFYLFFNAGCNFLLLNKCAKDYLCLLIPTSSLQTDIH